MSPDAIARDPWRSALVALLALWTLLLAAYSDTVVSLADIWSSSETYAHGYVVPLISLWLVWRVRHKILALQPVPAVSALLLMAIAAVLWLVGDMVSVNVVTHLAFITLLILTVPAVLGWTVARALTFPLLFLYFAAPVGDFMLPWLMERTADFTVLALRMSGIPVYREGLQFVIPSGNWSVVEACSGIRYLIASLMVGCLFAYLSYSSLRKRSLFMLVALMVPLLANWVRAYLIVLIGHLSGNELATGVDHLIYGWFFFGLVILAMLFIGARWADPVEPATKVEPVLAGGQAVPRWKLASVTALILLAPHVAWWGLRASVQATVPNVVSPVAAEPWLPHASPAYNWVPAIRRPAASWIGGFGNAAGQSVDLSISYFRQQTRDSKLVSSSNVFVTSKDDQWSKVEEGRRTIELAGQSLGVSVAILRDGAVGLTSQNRRLRVWRFYWVGDAFTASDVEAKVRGALQLLQRRGDDAAILTLSTLLDDQLPEPERVASADRVLTEFLQSQVQALRASLDATRKAR